MTASPRSLSKSKRRSESRALKARATSPAVYERTPAEAAAFQGYKDRLKSAREFTRLRRGSKEPHSVGFDHNDALTAQAVIMNAVGVVHSEEYASMVRTLGDLTQSNGTFDVDLLNQHLAMVAAIAPRDSVEALLATQMVAIHNATMVQARRLRGSDTIAQQDSNASALNKLARTFTMQIDGLKRYRSTREHRVVVEQVQVFPGGQAIVGSLSQTINAQQGLVAVGELPTSLPDVG